MKTIDFCNSFADSLTTGVDTLTGTAGNDTLNAGTSATWSAFDSIDGGNGTDAMTALVAATSTPGSVVLKNVETLTVNATGGGYTIDSTGYTGLTSLTVNNSAAGDVVATVSNTTAATVNNGAAGKTTVSGGLSQSVVSQAEDVALSGSVGAIVVDATKMANGFDTVVNGGTTVSVSQTATTTANGTTSGSISIGATSAPTGAVTVTASVGLATTTTRHASAQGTIGVKGGTSVTVTTSTNNAVDTTSTQAAVTVTGTTNTTAVTVKQDAAATASSTVVGKANGVVQITDVNDGSTTADKITSVTLASYGNSWVKSAALNTLTLSGTGGTFAADRTTDDTTNNATTLALNLGGGTLGAVTGTHLVDFTTVNIATSSATTTLADLQATGATTVNISGDKNLSFTAQGFASTAVITSTSTGSLTLGTALHVNQKYTGNTGVDTISVGATTKAINTGAGDDVVTVTVSALGTGGSINGGDGAGDALNITATLADAADASSAFATAVTGFEKLVLSGATTDTVKVATLGNYTDISSSGATSLTLAEMASGNTLRLTAAGTAHVISSTAALLSGTNDTLNLALTGILTAGAVVQSTGVTANDIETIAITSGYDSSMTSANITTALGTATRVNTATIAGNQAKTITVGGAAPLTLTAASTALTSFDASGNTTTGVLTWSLGATTASAVTVKGLAAGKNAIDLSATSASVVTYTGSSIDDTIVLSTAAKANVLTLGNGTNAVTGVSTGNNTITGGSGSDTFTSGTTGNNTIDFGDGTNAFTATSGNNTYTGGTGSDTVVVGTGSNTINVGGGTTTNSVTVGAAAGLNTITTTSTGVDTMVLAGIQTAAGYYSTLTGWAVGDKIDFAAVTTTPRADAALGAKITLGGAASFANYLDAATATVIADTGGPTVGASKMAWFQFGGNTYIVVDNVVGTGGTDTSTFQDGVDSVICLTGLIDLTTSTTATDVLTIVTP